MIEKSASANRPVYVEIDEEMGVITLLLLPQAARIKSLETDAKGDIRVEFWDSPLIRLLLHTDPNFDSLRINLQDALDHRTELLITETRDFHEIIDARPLPDPSPAPTPSASGETPPSPAPPPALPLAVSEARAQELFDLMAAETCDPCAPSSDCIPFLYADNGCQARAHKMCYLMVNDHGEEPEKVWNQGVLKVSTSNVPQCELSWSWHVAPILTVTTGGGTEKRVIDPSLGAGPESISDWQLRQGGGALQETPWTSYLWPEEFSIEFQTDPDMSRTDTGLALRRDLLQDRCLEIGPPPYNCTPDCFFVIDRSTFSEQEIEAMLTLSSPATIESAFYVITDGIPPYSLDIYSPSTSEVPALLLIPVPSGMTLTVNRVEFEFPDQLNRTQRITWVYDVTFTDTSAFTAEHVPIILEATVDTATGTGSLYLTQQPLPYEIDGPTSWLSTDLRVFKLKAGQSKFGETMGTDPSQFITGVISNLNADTAGGETFEDDIPTSYSDSPLELSQVDGTYVYNFAIAKVRYRATSTTATDVRVFFRLFPYAATTLSYDQATTYRRHESAGHIIPLLGVHGDDFTSIPCFANNRINSATHGMTNQTDSANIQTIDPNPSGEEVVRYFGCWLDINQTTAQFPLSSTSHDGPFPSDRLSIQELIRHQHQCLVSEIVFSPTPIPIGATPSTSDKLAQRNLSIIESANPGLYASRRISQTFELRPVTGKESGAELMFDWGNIPKGSRATLYLPGIDTDEVLRVAARLYRSHRMVRIDAHTLKFDTGGIGYLPIPVLHQRMPGMLTIDLPEGITKGQQFNMVVRQVSGVYQRGQLASTHVVRDRGIRSRRIIGSFQVTIPVSEKATMLPKEQRLLSNLRWIERSIPASDIWAPVFSKYVTRVADRVDALGGNSADVGPSPTGEWRASNRICTLLAVLIPAVLALLLIGIGISGGAPALAGSPVAALLLLMGYIWFRVCNPPLCHRLFVVIAGAGAGAIGLGIAALLGVAASQLIPTLLASFGVAVVTSVVAGLKGCFRR